MNKLKTVNEVYAEWTHFLSKINFTQSFFDARSILFMNEFKENLDNLNTQHWRPIETAPKDGTWIRLWRGPAEIGRRSCEEIATWYKFDDEEFGCWRWPYQDCHDLNTPKGQAVALHEIAIDEDFSEDPSFTHWMPLATPPIYKD